MDGIASLPYFSLIKLNHILLFLLRRSSRVARLLPPRLRGILLDRVCCTSLSTGEGGHAGDGGLDVHASARPFRVGDQGMIGSIASIGMVRRDGSMSRSST